MTVRTVQVAAFTELAYCWNWQIGCLELFLQKFPLFLQKLLQNLSFYFLIFRRMCICLWTDKIKKNKKEASQVLCLFITEIGAKFLPQRLAILAVDKSVCSNEPG